MKQDYVPWDLTAEYTKEKINVVGTLYTRNFGVYASSNGQLGWAANPKEPAINPQDAIKKSATSAAIGAMLYQIAVGPLKAKEFPAPLTMESNNKDLVRRILTAIQGG